MSDADSQWAEREARMLVRCGYPEYYVTDVVLRALTGEIEKLADVFDQAHRFGAEQDDPEGGRYLQISDTLARVVSAKLRRIAGAVAAVPTISIYHAGDRVMTAEDLGL